MRKALLTLAITGLLGSAFPVYAVTFDTTGSISSAVPEQDTTFNFGRDGGAYSYVGMNYRPSASHNICSAKFILSAQGNPTDAVRLQLRLGTTTAITTDLQEQGTLVAESDAHLQVRGSLAEREFFFTPCAVVVGANEYFFVLFRDGSFDNTNYYKTSTGFPTTYSGLDTIGNPALAQKDGSALLKLPCDSTDCYPIALFGTENYGAISPTSTPSFAQSIIDKLLGINDSNATTSAASDIAAFSNIPGFFAEKIPWGYLFDIRDIYVAAATSSTEFGEIAFDFGNSGLSTSTKSWLPSRLVVFSTTTVTYYFNGNALAGANTLASAVGWVLLIMYWYKRATSV